MRRLGGLVAFTGLLGFFVSVISFTLRLENFLSSIEVLTELDKLRGALGKRFQTLGWWVISSTPLGVRNLIYQ